MNIPFVLVGENRVRICIYNILYKSRTIIKHIRAEVGPVFVL